MDSPFTGKPMPLKTRTKTLPFRKENFDIVYQYYHCEESGEEFVTPEIGDLNLIQVYNAYRVKHNIPFPEEIKDIRLKYGLPANKMAEILGFGINMYRAYENGEIPSESNARLIQAASNPEEFKRILSYSNVLGGRDLSNIIDRIDLLIKNAKESVIDKEEYIMDGKIASEYTGYKTPNLELALNVIIFFSKRLKPWQTVLNKLLFYADFGHYKMHGRSITGLSYRAIPFGVVPRSYDKLFSEAVSQQLVDIQYYEFDNFNVGKKYISNIDFNSELFSEKELNTLEQVLNKFQLTTTGEIVRLNHEEVAWFKHEQQRELVSYQNSFYLQHF